MGWRVVRLLGEGLEIGKKERDGDGDGDGDWQQEFQMDDRMEFNGVKLESVEE